MNARFDLGGVGKSKIHSLKVRRTKFSKKIIFAEMKIFAVAKGQKMAMKNYAKQLNAQIEEVVAEVRMNLFIENILLDHHSFCRFEIH